MTARYGIAEWYRFEQDGTLPRWLAEIVGFDPPGARLAREVPFRRCVGSWA